MRRAPALHRMPDGRYYITHYIGKERKKHYIPGPDNRPCREEAYANAYFAEWRLDHPDVPVVELPADTDPRITRITDYYVDTYLPASNAKPKTVTSARKHLWEFVQFCATKRIGRHSQVSGEVVEKFSVHLQAQKKHPNTVIHYITTVRAAFKQAVEAGIIPETGVKRWIMPTAPDPEIRPLTADELRLLLKRFAEHATEPMFLPVVRHLAYTGQRPSDAFNLRRDQVNLETGWVERNNVKQRRLRRYRLTPAALENLRAIPGEDPYFFRRPENTSSKGRGQLWTINSFGYHWKQTMMRFKFPRTVVPYDLRHTFATIMANEPIKCPLADLQAMLGHTDINMTLRYNQPTGAEAACQQFTDLIAP